MVDIDEKSRKGKLAIGLLKEMGYSPLQTPTATEWGMPSKRKADSAEIYAMIEEAEKSETILLSEGIKRYKTKK